MRQDDRRWPLMRQDKRKTEIKRNKDNILIKELKKRDYTTLPFLNREHLFTVKVVIDKREKWRKNPRNYS